MAEAASGERRSLSDIMLAMDVVDTLRHRRVLVEKELNSDERQQKLLDRLREIYASQGIEVSDEVLQAGVDALREERFSYQPPTLTPAVRLARIYVRRDRWGKWALAAVAALLLVWFAYAWFVTGPAERRVESEVAALNSEIGATTERIQALEQEANRIAAQLGGYVDGVPQPYVKVADNRLADVQRELLQADGLIEKALRLNQEANLEADTFEARAAGVRDRLQAQLKVVAELDARLSGARSGLADIDSLKIFPAQFTQLAESARSSAREKQVAGMVDKLVADGMSALIGGQIREAEAALNELRSINTRLLQRYSLLVVARDGEQSGIWRVPERNPEARNYYLIVEAVASDGQVLTLSMTNEETGRLVETKKWGLRVNERVYQRVRADKLDDGIIQGRRVGEKRRGYLQPDYLIETSGAVITEW